MEYYNKFVDLKVNGGNTKTDWDTIELVHGILGMSGESGEVADLVKKYMFQGHDLDKGKMVEELGDTLFYITHLLNCLNVGLEECIEANMNKLDCRYGGRCTPSESVCRDKVAEQKIFDKWRD